MRTIEIKIISQKSESPSPDSGSSNDNEENGSGNGSKKPSIMSTTQFAAYEITKNVISTVSSEAEYAFGKYTQITEDYKTGNYVKNAKAAISTASNFASSAVSGAMTGFIATGGNPIGAVVGAVVGAVSTGINSYISAKNEYNDAMMQINNEAYSNYFYSERAGYADGGRGTNN